MQRSMNIRKLLAALMVSATLFDAVPASAQVMPQLGFEIPWFRSAAERRDREACEQELPNCKSSVRQEIAKEKAASLITPWLILGVCVLLALIYLRRQEQKKALQRQRAQRKHDPKKFKKLGEVAEDRGDQESADTL